MESQIFLYFSLVFLVSAYASDIEQTCYSRFDYDEKMLKTLLCVENSVGQLKKRLRALEKDYEQSKKQSQEYLEGELVKLADQIKDYREEIAGLQEMSNHTTTHSELSENAATSKPMSVFLATYVESSSSSSSLRFTTTVTNIGNDYSSSTGKFTCEIPGTYFFSSTLVKTRDGHPDRVNCFLTLNDIDKVQFYIDPADTNGSDAGAFSATNTALLQLDNGDEVYIKCSTPVSSLYYSPCSFSGFLLQADNN